MVALVFIYLCFYSQYLLFSFPQGYGEEGLYSEQEAMASAPIFESGIVGKDLLTKLNKALKRGHHNFHIVHFTNQRELGKCEANVDDDNNRT